MTAEMNQELVNLWRRHENLSQNRGGKGQHDMKKSVIFASFEIMNKTVGFLYCHDLCNIESNKLVQKPIGAFLI